MKFRRYQGSKIIQFSSLIHYFVFDWTTECWNWKFHKTSDGYGRVSYAGKARLAHRLSKYLYGDINWKTFMNPDKILMHTCDNPACINPGHLRVGTQLENIADRVKKGRCARKRDNRDASGRFISKSTAPTGALQGEKKC